MGRDNQQAVSYDARCLAVGRGIHGPEEIKIGPRQRQTVAPTSCDAILVAGFARPSARCASLAERSFGRMTRSVAARALCPLRYRAGRGYRLSETQLRVRTKTVRLERLARFCADWRSGLDIAKAMSDIWR